MQHKKANNSNRLVQQRGLGVGVLLVALVIYCVVYYFISSLLAYSWLFGLVVGFILQRSRICFTAAIRDPLLFGMTELSRALLLSLIISSSGFALLQYYRMSQGLSLVGRFVSLGWQIPIGAFIFGIGAAFSGGCASGTLMRIGEGFEMQLVVLLGFIMGSTHGAHDASWWYQLMGEGTTHLPRLIGWKEALLLHFGLLLLLYLSAYWWEEYQFKN